jgi:hypothetical protein
MTNYDPDKDQSEKYGWKKICEEHIPTEENERWGRIMLLSVGALILIAFLLGAWN